MVKTLLAISFVLLVGAAGVTVAAAQGSQPGEPIYAIKAWTDQAHTFLQTRTQIQAAQVTGQSVGDPGLADRDRIQLQTQDMQQDQDRIQLQTQDMLQTQEQLQTQDRDSAPTSNAGYAAELAIGFSSRLAPVSKARSGATGDKGMTAPACPIHRITVVTGQTPLTAISPNRELTCPGIARAGSFVAFTFFFGKTGNGG